MTPKQKAKKWRKPEKYGALAARDPEAFEVFFVERRFTAVAKKFRVSAAAVGKHAEKHAWVDRLAKRVATLEEKTTAKLAERLARDAHRQYDLLSLGEANAMNILKRPNLQAGDHIKPADLAMTMSALEHAIKGKRLLAGESTENTAITFKDFMLRMHEIAGIPI